MAVQLHCFSLSDSVVILSHNHGGQPSKETAKHSEHVSFWGARWSQNQWLKSGKHQWGWDCFFIPLFSVVLYMRGLKRSGFQPAINTPCQFEKVFLILSTTSEGFFPLELSSKWWRDFWTTINGNVNTRYSCVHRNMYTYRNTHDYRNHRAFGCSLLSLEYWDKTLLDFLVSSQGNLTANQLPMRHDCF